MQIHLGQDVHVTAGVSRRGGAAPLHHGHSLQWWLLQVSQLSAILTHEPDHGCVLAERLDLFTAVQLPAALNEGTVT